MGTWKNHCSSWWQEFFLVVSCSLFFLFKTFKFKALEQWLRFFIMSFLSEQYHMGRVGRVKVQTGHCAHGWIPKHLPGTPQGYTCSRGLGTGIAAPGSPSFLEHQVVPLSVLISCGDTRWNCTRLFEEIPCASVPFC